MAASRETPERAGVRACVEQILIIRGAYQQGLESLVLEDPRRRPRPRRAPVRMAQNTQTACAVYDTEVVHEHVCVALPLPPPRPHSQQSPHIPSLQCQGSFIQIVLRVKTQFLLTIIVPSILQVCLAINTGGTLRLLLRLLVLCAVISVVVAGSVHSVKLRLLSQVLETVRLLSKIRWTACLVGR